MAATHMSAFAVEVLYSSASVERSNSWKPRTKISARSSFVSEKTEEGGLDGACTYADNCNPTEDDTVDVVTEQESEICASVLRVVDGLEPSVVEGSVDDTLCEADSGKVDSDGLCVSP